MRAWVIVSILVSGCAIGTAPGDPTPSPTAVLPTDAGSTPSDSPPPTYGMDAGTTPGADDACDPAFEACPPGPSGSGDAGGPCDPWSDPTCDPGPSPSPPDGGVCDPWTDPGCDPGGPDAGCDPWTDPTCDPGPEPDCDPWTDPSCDPGAGPGDAGVDDCDPWTDPDCLCCHPIYDPWCDFCF